MDTNVDRLILSQCDCQDALDAVEYDIKEVKNISGLGSIPNYIKNLQTKKHGNHKIVLLAAYEGIA